MNMNLNRITWALVGLGALGCSVPTDFACTGNGQCGVGQCIAGGCAFPSDECPSELIYGALSPELLAGKCVEADSGVADQDGSGEDTTLDTSGSSTSAGSDTSDSGDGDSGDGDSGESDSGESDSGESESDTTDTDTDTDSGTTGEIPDTAIAHYSFDEIAAQVIFDSSGNNYHAEMDNSQLPAAGIVGDGLSFANLDRVIVPIEVLAGRTAFTVEFYVKVSQPAALREFVFYYGHELDTALTPNLTAYVEYAYGPPKTARVLWTQAPMQTTGLIGNTQILEGQWRHVALTFSNQGMRVYVDHFLDASDPLVPGLLSPNLEWIQIGGVPSGFGSFFGVIDELRFSEGALTPAQMQSVP